MGQCTSKPIDNIISDDLLFNRYEGKGIFAFYRSLIHELSNHKSADLSKIFNDTDFDNFTGYLSRGVPDFYHNLVQESLPNFNPNGIDALLALIIIGTYYGVRSEEYNNYKMNIYKFNYMDYHDLSILDIPIDCLEHMNKKFINPEKTIMDTYYPESEDPNCYRIPNTCTLIIYSDWATGTRSALNLIAEVAEFKPDYLIHLGDVYYSGRVEEYKSRYIRPIEQYFLSQCPTAKIFMLPGNHDYYSGTDGVHYTLRHFKQNRSFFSMYNDNVQIEGFDTGFNDSDCFHDVIHGVYNTYLVESELDWHKNRIAVSKEHQRKLLLLSHHQIISPWSPAGTINGKTAPINPRLFSQCKDFLNDTELWLYGHDHTFAIMEPYIYEDITIKRARLIGNGDCQYRSDETMGQIYNFEVSDVPVPNVKNIYPSSRMNLLNNSFVLLKIKPTYIRVIYYEIPQITVNTFKSPQILFKEKILLK